MALDLKEIKRRHDYHPPRPGTLDASDHQHLRDFLKDTAVRAEGLFRDTAAQRAPREQALFHTALEEAGFWAHAALARGRAVAEQDGGGIL